MKLRRTGRDGNTLIVPDAAVFVVDHYEDGNDNVVVPASRITQAHAVLQRTGPDEVTVSKDERGDTGTITRAEARRRFGVNL